MSIEEVRDIGGLRDAFVPPGAGGRWPWSPAIVKLLGLMSVMFAVVATCWWAIPQVEARLDENVRGELQSAGIDTEQLNFNWDYRDVAVSGSLGADVTEEQLRVALQKADNKGIRGISLALDAVDETPAQASRFGTVDVNVALADGKLQLDGNVLTEAQRDQLQSAAEQAIGSAAVTNNIIVTGFQEQTPGSDQRVASLANSIAGLSGAVSADARLSATDFRFNATVPDEALVDDLLRIRGNAGDIGLVISGDIVAHKSVPGSVMDVAAKKENGRVFLTGTVLSETHKTDLLRAASRAFDSQSVVDELVVDDVPDAAREAASSVAVLASAIEYFDDAIEADAKLTAEEFNFNALLEFEEDTVPLLALRDSAKNLNVKLTGTIEARQMALSKEVDLLQAEIDSLALEIKENVVFDSAKADLDFTAKQTLDKIVDAMNRYQRPVVQIGGHTDDSGPDDSNQKLSLFRATAVLEYMKLSGIDGLRMRALGFGESSPLASNSTEVGKKQNRRVEFRALGNFGN